MPDVSTDGRLVLDGALTVRNATAICAALLKALEQHPAVSVDCSAAEEADVSFIQLLAASRISASGAGKTVTLAARPDGALLAALTSGGFQVTNEDAAGAPAFWFAGAAA